MKVRWVGMGSDHHSLTLRTIPLFRHSGRSAAKTRNKAARESANLSRARCEFTGADAPPCGLSPPLRSGAALFRVCGSLRSPSPGMTKGRVSGPSAQRTIERATTIRPKPPRKRCSPCLPPSSFRAEARLRRRPGTGRRRSEAKAIHPRAVSATVSRSRAPPCSGSPLRCARNDERRSLATRGRLGPEPGRRRRSFVRETTLRRPALGR